MEITIDDFAKVDIRIGTVIMAEPIEGSEKLLKLQVDFGPSSPPVGGSSGQVNSLEQATDVDTDSIGKRQILSDIAKFYTPQDLIGKQFPFIVNLSPRTMMGLESQGMILATGAEDGTIALLSPNKPITPGSRIK